MKAAVVLFPGSNREGDALRALRTAGIAATTVWHTEHGLPEGTDLAVLPGGFSYGDYLRCGAIAGRSPVMDAVRTHAARGGLVLGICNGFQILCEAGLLPGALLRNAGLKYICKQVHLRTETVESAFTNQLRESQILKMPIGHMEGNYFCDGDTLSVLEREDRVAFRYCSAQGEVTPEANPNGSLSNIAGILNQRRNVLGMMPHPDRSSEELLGSSDGFSIFRSLLTALSAHQEPQLQR